MSAQTTLLILVPVSYLVGSIPFGLIVGLAKGVDPRRAGSGNIGATNVGRLLGGKYFALVFTLDLLKGLIPMLVAAIVLHDRAHSALDYLLWLLVGFAAVLGHMFSIFLGFKGGKGVATSAGVGLGVFPYYTPAILVAVLVFLLMFGITRIVSVGSIVGVAVIPVAYVASGLMMDWDVFGTQLPLLAFAVLISGMVIYRHRGNIARLRAGTEGRFARTKDRVAG
jgi:glycerol-3-phosphate acyltransferase PlsY